MYIKRYFLFFLSLAVILISCKTINKPRRKKSRHERKIVDIKSPDSFAINTFKVCNNNEAFKIEASSHSKYVDRFEYKACKVNSEVCDYTGKFFIETPYLIFADPGKYSISVNTCFKEQCSNFSETNDFVQPITSPETKKQINKQIEKIAEIGIICEEIKNEMKTYLNRESEHSKFKDHIKKTSKKMSITQCRQMLSSNELQIIDTLNKIFSYEDDSLQVESEDNIVTVEERHRIEGLMFLSLGALGSGLSLYQIVKKWRETISKRGRELGQQIIELSKKGNLLKVKEYELRIKELKAINDDIKSHDFKLKRENSVARNIRKRNKNIDLYMDSIIKEWNGYPKEYQMCIDLKKDLSIKNMSGDQVWERIEDIWGSYNSRNFLSDTSYDSNQYMGFRETKYERLRDHVDSKYFFENLTTKLTEADYRGLEASNLNQISQNLTKRIDVYTEAKTDLVVSWKKFITEIATNTFKKGAKGAIIGGASGAGVGAILSSTVSVLLTPVGIKYGAIAGSGVGGVKGSYEGFMEKYNELKSPTWTGDEQIKMTNAEGNIKKTKEFKQEIVRNKQQVEGEYKIESTKGSYGEKFKAAFPYVVTAGLSALTTYIGAEEAFGLSANSAKSEFLKNYISLYKKAKNSLQELNQIEWELLNGKCSL